MEGETGNKPPHLPSIPPNSLDPPQDSSGFNHAVACPTSVVYSEGVSDPRRIVAA